MAVVQLADIYEPITFNQGVQEAATERNVFIQSGVVVDDPRLSAMASSGGTTGDIPFFFGLTNDEPDYTSDDPAVTSTPAKISGTKQIWRLANMHKSWSTMDLARELALADPLGAIISRIGHYWSTAYQRRVIQSALGLLNDSVANHGGDLLFSVATDDPAAVTAAERISADAVISAAATMGDAASQLSVIAMHSVVYNTLQRNDLITFRPTSVQDIKIPTYLGYDVIVDDALPAVAGINRITYTTILFSRGVTGMGSGKVIVPSEIERSASAGNGGGQDIIHTRKSVILHPAGYAWQEAAVAGQSPTEAELANALNWARVYQDRKNIGIAFLQTNG